MSRHLSAVAAATPPTTQPDRSPSPMGAILSWMTSRGAGRSGGVVALLALLATVVLVGGVVGAFTVGDHTRNRPRPSAETSGLGPNSFVSVYDCAGTRCPEARGGLVVSDARTGALTRRLLSLSYEGMAVSGTAMDDSGQLWVTLSAGPRCTGPTAGCGPQPHSCRGEVLRFGPDLSQPQVILRTGPDERISQAAPSPDGRLLAYLDGGCITSYFNQHLEVMRLGQPGSWSLGAGLLPCHDLSGPHWSAEGTRLVVAYGPSLLTKPTPGMGEGICLQASASGILSVNALAGQAGLSGDFRPPDAGCQVDQIVPTGSGMAGIERCGSPRFVYLDGPVYLVRYDMGLHETSRSSLGRCANGAGLAADRSGRDLIISTYQFCNPPGTRPPKTILFVDRGHGPVRVTTVAAGNLVFSALSW